MKEYYDVLQVDEAAEAADIKKAYFKRIRQYPPDKEPRMFQKIREAYEFLQKRENREIYKIGINLPPSIQGMYYTAHRFYLEKNYQSVINLCKAALECEPSSVDMKLMLGQAYLMNEETGKAVKIFDSIVKENPNVIQYRIRLGKAYLERGWNKKAIDVFDDIYYNEFYNEKQYRISFAAEKNNNSSLMINEETSFFIDYINCCQQCRQFNKAREAAYTYLNDEKSEKSNKIKILRELIIVDIESIRGYIKEDFDFFSRFVSEVSFDDERVFNCCISIAECIIDNYDEYIHSTNIMVELLKYLNEIPDSYNDGISSLYIKKGSMLYEKNVFLRDSRLNDDDIIEIAEFYYDKLMLNEYKDTFSLFNMEEYYMDEIKIELLEVNLILLDELPKIKQKLNIIKQEYPILTELMKDILDTIENARSIPYLISKLEKEIIKKRGYPKNSRLTRNRDRSGNDNDDFNYTGTEPFKRETKKIGRNDPCPCGSGKKYKKCCG